MGRHRARGGRGWVAALAVGLVPVPAVAAVPPLWRLSLTVDRIAWLASVEWNAGRAQGLVLERRLSAALPVELGLAARRLDVPYVRADRAGELLASAAYAPGTGAWQPALGLEAGWSGGVQIDWRAYHGPGWAQMAPLHRAPVPPLVVGVVAQPLRFGWGHVSAGLLSLSAGQLGGGRVLRVQVGLGQLGVRW